MKREKKESIGTLFSAFDLFFRLSNVWDVAFAPRGARISVGVSLIANLMHL